MKRYRAIIFCAFLATVAASGMASAQPGSNAEVDFAERLKTVSAATQTIECEFTLTRTMAFMAADVVSTGEFYYMRGVGISLEFTQPAGDRITMGREKFRIVAGGKTTTMKFDSNPMLGQLKRMLTACMTGDVAALSEGAVMSLADSGANYVVTLTPDSRRAKMIKLITLTFEKEHMSLISMRMEEASGDVSAYKFYNKKFNKGVDPQRFDVK